MRVLVLLFGAMVASSASANPHPHVELHAHLFMKEGMGIFFRGDFFGPIRATSASDRLSSQANPQTLQESKIGILIVALYSHPFMTLSVKDSIRRQIALAERFVLENPKWIIARSAEDAQKALSEGKRVLVLSLEGAAGVLDTDEDFREFIDERDVRIVTLLHLTDDHLGGVAFLAGWRGLASPFAFVQSLFSPSARDADGHPTNPGGLTASGRALSRKLVEHGIWIDLAHSSDAVQAELIPMLEAAGHPLLYTHTSLRRYYGGERGLSESQLQAVGRTRGLVGLMPSPEMLGVATLAQQFKEIETLAGPAAATLGTDFNGAMPRLPELVHIGHTPQVWTELEASGVKPGGRIERFLEAWKAIQSK